MGTKTESVFYPARARETARANAAKYPWAARMREEIIQRAAPWAQLSDGELWEAMFGSTITRSWMVWSNGHCPACKKDVPMYDWQIDAFKKPWKVRCPHCRELFPKNDFHGFYSSGLDEQGVFDPRQADRTLLFNAEHPDPRDPLHMYGVDDGEGYVEGDKRWRFIGAYLIWGQWKQVVLGGIRHLAAAYVVTGDKSLAHRALVLLDRVADLYPTFDFESQGLAYEKSHGPGYVSTWHDACIETYQLAMAYDQVFEAIEGDRELAAFLSEKSKRFNLANPKTSAGHIRRNIEERILNDAIQDTIANRSQNRNKIMCNFPNTDVTMATIMIVLGWPHSREEVLAFLDPAIEKATAVDGVTGEKGLTGYSAFTIQGLAGFLEQCGRLDTGFLSDMFRRHPRLRDTYRFHIDTWCMQKYYPLVGDCGSFAWSFDQYQGLSLGGPRGFRDHFDATPPVSMRSLLWRLHRLTGDAGFVQVLYRANGESTEGLPHDLFAEDPEAVQEDVAQVIRREGPVLRLGSVNKEEWHLAILRSGDGNDGRAVWVNYDSGRGHSHADGMNLGLFAKGLDLMPDFGYPPVKYGGWNTPRAAWYKMTAAHNTVVVDGKDHEVAAGETTLWAQGQRFQVVRLSGPGLTGGRQFERTVAMVDISDSDFYVVDIFRVIGGTDHAKFTHSHFGRITLEGLSLAPAGDYGHGTQMRNFRVDPAPEQGWSVDWAIEDRYRLAPPSADIHLHYTDLTAGAQAFVAEKWISVESNPADRRARETMEPEAWIPCVLTRRQAEEGPLASTFVSVLEPYEGTSNIASIRRLPLETVQGTAYPDAHVAIEIQLKDGRSDLFVAADIESALGPVSPGGAAYGGGKAMVQKHWGVEADAELGMIRRDAAGRVQHVALCGGESVVVGDMVLKLEGSTGFVEVECGSSFGF